MSNSKKTPVLFSPSTRRVIWGGPNLTVTLKLNESFEATHEIHAAPIGIDAMSESFSNRHVQDWVRAEIEDEWSELQHLSNIQIP